MTRLFGILTAAALLLGLATPSPATAADKVQRGEKYVTDAVAAECRRLQLDNATCTSIGGMDISEQQVADYEQSWVHRALALQRGLDDNAPFVDQLLPHTHNSFNSSAYDLTLTQTDPNQLYSMRDQLRMDIRAIEMDVHKWPHVDDKGVALNDVVLCHGNTNAVGPVSLHIGCSNDRPFTDGLKELKAWLLEPQNADEVVLLYLENNLDGDLGAHQKAALDIARVLGRLVYRPVDHGAKPCDPMPMTRSRAAIRMTGARVLIVGNCGPGPWGRWVYQRGPLWNERLSGVGGDYAKTSDCAAERARQHYGTDLIRRWEDTTSLSNTLNGTGVADAGEITVPETERMVRCGVNLIGFDRLYPQDPRLAKLVWSWAPDEPRADVGNCAQQRPDGRFKAGPCTDPLPLACRTTAGAWLIATKKCPAGSRLSVPVNGYDNEQLRAAKHDAGVATVLLAYLNTKSGWTPV